MATECKTKDYGYVLSLIGAVVFVVGWAGLSGTVSGTGMLGIMLMLLGITFMIKKSCK